MRSRRLVNLFFAVVYLCIVGIANAREGSFADAFLFSVQTVGTIGYGAMYPKTLTAQLAVTVESIAARVVAAVATGLVFSKFSIPQARLEFAREACIFRYDGLPTLALRLSNTSLRLPLRRRAQGQARRAAGAGLRAAPPDHPGAPVSRRRFQESRPESPSARIRSSTLR